MFGWQRVDKGGKTVAAGPPLPPPADVFQRYGLQRVVNRGQGDCGPLAAMQILARLSAYARTFSISTRPLAITAQTLSTVLRRVVVAVRASQTMTSAAASPSTSRLALTARLSLLPLSFHARHRILTRRP